MDYAENARLWAGVKKIFQQNYMRTYGPLGVHQLYRLCYDKGAANRFEGGFGAG